MLVPEGLAGLKEEVELVPAGGVDQDLDRAELALNPGDRRVHRVVVGHVQVHGERRFGRGVLDDVARRDAVPVGGEGGDDRAADPAGSAGHQCQSRWHAGEQYDGAGGPVRPRGTPERARAHDRQPRRGQRARARRGVRPHAARPVGHESAAVAARRARPPRAHGHVLRRGDQLRAVSGRGRRHRRPADTSSVTTVGATSSGQP